MAERAFMTFRVLSVDGWPHSVISVQRSKPDEHGNLIPDSQRFFRTFDQPFDCSLSPGRVAELSVVENEGEPSAAHCVLVLDDVLAACHLKKGGCSIFTYDLSPSGKVTFSAQAYPQKERAWWIWRRGAQKLAKVHVNAGHQFTVHFFTEMTTCLACNEVFWGFQQQGLKCQFCQMTIHKNCASRSIPICPRQKLPHEFGPAALTKPKRCHHDRRLIWPCFSTTRMCINCGIVVHRPCVELVDQACPGKVTATSVGFSTEHAPIKDAQDEDYEYDYANYQYPAILPDHVAAARADKAPLWLKPNIPYSLGNFRIICVLGQGSFGKVFLARFVQDNEDESPPNKPKLFALKAVRKDRIAVNLEVTRVERKILQISSRSPFLLHLLCTFQTESHLFYAVDFVAGGAIFFHIQFCEGNFGVDRARFYAAEVVCALEFLHKRHIIYRDLKSDNVMLDLSGHIRLIDFGLSKDELGPDDTAHTICGTPSHIAPEIVKGQPYSFAVDWWSFGAFLYEMLVGYVPFLTESGPDVYSFLARQYEDLSLPSYEDISDESAVEMLKRLFERDPDIRLGNRAGSVRDQPFFASIDWKVLETGEAEPPHPRLLPPRVARKVPIRYNGKDEFIDVSYFEGDAINEPIALSRIDDNIARTMVGHMFRNFSLTNVEYSLLEHA